jgi:tripartite-type tricarboxylate transporter receptor subunit TctC
MEGNVMKRKDLWNPKKEKTVQGRNAAGRSRGMQRALRTTVAIMGVVLLIGAMVAPLCAQSYPNKPIRLILPMAPGGPTDILGRIIGQQLAERLGQPVVPENRPGAGGNIGIEFVAKARPDGYTILLVGSPISVSPSLYKKLNYDPIKDFAPISLTAQTHLAVIVQPSLPVKNLKELVEYVKANPGKLTFGSAGIGTAPHLANVLLNSLAKIDMVQVPYKGAGPALIGLMSGEVAMVVIGAAAATPQIQAGKVRALAVFSNKRLPSLPNVPTTKEAGIDNLVVTGWSGILAPAGTPRNILNRLNEEWIRIAAMPDTMEKMDNAGLEPLSSTPEQYSEFIKAEIVRWAKVVKDSGITIN